MDLIRELERIRKAKKLSQEGMAREIGITTLYTYQRWASKRCKPSPAMREKIMAYLAKQGVIK